ncbi:hypothetical protein GCM10009128_13330 [Psychrosphaera haliotis]|uniref:type II secretion system protein GspM n=1 Tax=Psychrosphaera haliotis TaxID=555083 RepID=UPI0031CDDC71
MSQWSTWNEKFIALTQREKVIVAAAIVFLVTYGFFFLAIKPALLEQSKLTKSQAKIEKQVSMVRDQISDIQVALRKDPNELLKQEINQVKSQLKEVESKLTSVMAEYVAPEQMVRELTRLLETERQIRVTGLSAQPPELIKGEIPEGEEVELPELYSHEFELIVDGEYFPLMNFVKTIVARNKQFSVEDLKYEVSEHPKAQLTLTLVTIGDSKNVIRL